MRFISLTLSLALLTLYASSTTRADPNGTAILNPEVDAAVNAILADWNTPGGVAIAVVRRDDSGGWQIETKGYGTAKADGTKIGPDTLFDILSTGLLISNESLSPRISWTTKIGSLIPDWELMDPVASSESTITDLMSHRTGLPRHDVAFSLSIFDEVPSIVKRLRYLKPSTGFRENTQYSNLMYTVLSYLPTALLPDKPPFARYVKEHILDPLGMNSSTYSFAVANATGNLADGFAREGINVTENPVGPGTTRVLPYLMPGVTEDGNGFSGPGGVLSTAVDMASTCLTTTKAVKMVVLNEICLRQARWLQMLLLNGQHPVTNVNIVPAAVIGTVQTGVSVWDGNACVLQFNYNPLLSTCLGEAPELSPLVYGGAQIQSTYRGHVMIEHGGDWIGFHSQITRFPIDGFGIAVLTNDDTFGSVMLEVVKYRVIDSFFGLDPVDWNTRYQTAIAESEVPPPVTTAPANATQPLPISALARTYRNLGYGADIELCAVVNAGPDASPACKTLAQQLNSTFPDQLAGVDLVWVWPWGNVGTGASYIGSGDSYYGATHFNGGVYNLTAWTALPTVNDSSTPFWAYPAGTNPGLTAEFDINTQKGTVAGFGLRGIWGAGTVEAEPMGKSVEERSEVWYVVV
ncbi:Beta-lactamase class penicillin binding protein [Mycena sanguinolenta]|uniref:Beta-lactamase class penicillin binding protein n=1 Tax=Mycena sanguinolenta TaxID=230812 RepID=A0A8H6XCG8_9AGAR|nr:Beta-lactamase class penicillin binding protein [Mycena sanguinolenta]